MNETAEQRVALVTGAASGIGRASALAFAEAGARVVVADVDEDGGRETVRLIEEVGGAALWARTDVSDAAAVDAAVAAALDRWGRLDQSRWPGWPGSAPGRGYRPWRRRSPCLAPWRDFIRS